MFLEHLTVEVRSKTYMRLGVILHKDLDLVCTPRFCDVGEWQLRLTADHPLAKELSKPGAGIIVYYRNKVLLSGPMTSAELETDEEGLGVRAIKGVCDNVIFDDTLAWPKPNRGLDDQSDGYHKVEGLPASRALVTYVWFNAGAGAIESRKRSELRMDPLNPAQAPGSYPGPQTAVEHQTRFDPLLQVGRELVNKGCPMWQVRQDPDNEGLLFNFPDVIDPQGNVRFDTRSLGGVESTGATVAAPTITRAIMGGVGHLQFRAFEQVTASGTVEADWNRRIERFGDERGSVASAELQAAGAEMLEEGGKTQVAQTIELTEDSRYEWGEDFTLGSIARIVLEDNTEQEARIEAVALIADSEGVRVGIQVGEKDAEARSILSRVSSLERIEITGASDWTTLSTNSPWVPHDGFNTPRWRVSNGEVILAGLIKGGAAGVSAISLPASIHPPLTAWFFLSANGGAARGTVGTGGGIVIDGFVSGGTNAWVSLDGIRYFLT